MSEAIQSKSVEDILDYSINWARFLVTDTIVAIDVWTIDAGLTNAAMTNTSTVSTVWLSGGVTGTTYNVVNTVTTAGGRVKTFPFQLTVHATTEPD